MEIESSLVLTTGDGSDERSVDCWTRPKELNSCFSLPDDDDVSRNVGGVLGKVGGDGSDFLVAVGDDDWWDVELGLSKS